MQRRMMVIAPLTVLALALAACGGGAKDGEETKTGAATGTNGDAVTYWLWDANQKPVYEACAAAFTENTGIGVSIEQYGWGDYWSGLTNNFVAGGAPDVFTNHVSQYPQFAA